MFLRSERNLVHNNSAQCLIKIDRRHDVNNFKIKMQLYKIYIYIYIFLKELVTFLLVLHALQNSNKITTLPNVKAN